MSPKAVDWALSTRGPKNAARLVLIVLASHAGGEDHEAWPGMALIASEANVTENTAKAAIRELIEAGYIEREVNVAPRRKGVTRGPLRNLYRLHVGWTEDEIDGQWGAHIDPHSDGQWGAICDANGGKSTRAMGGDLRADPPITPISLNQQGTNDEPPPAGADGGQSIATVERTPGQRAHASMRWLYDGITNRDGVKPVSIHPPALVKLLTPFAERYTDAQIRPALRTLWDEGRPITRATLEAQIGGRGHRRRPTTTTDRLREIEFDADGNMV